MRSLGPVVDAFAGEGGHSDQPDAENQRRSSSALAVRIDRGLTCKSEVAPNVAPAQKGLFLPL